MVTGRDVFDIAMVLIDEQDPRTGRTDGSENREYMVRSPGLLNLLMQEACEVCFHAGGIHATRKVRDLGHALDLDDRVCTGVLPYGLAGLLVMEENPRCSGILLDTYKRLLETFRRSSSGATHERIDNAYGGFEK